MDTTQPNSGVLRRYLPSLTWGAEYSRRTLINDLVVAAIVTIMLIPQSLACALLAGLPLQVGLFASMANSTSTRSSAPRARSRSAA
jgi:MFS superfamily sulfate permease-like transporter